jgi:hypothetical protein
LHFLTTETLTHAIGIKFHSLEFSYFLAGIDLVNEHG